MSNSMPPRTKQLHDLLFGRGDVSIASLFTAMGGPDSMCADSRSRAAWLSPYIRRLNKHLPSGLVCEPGEVKQTYRIVSTR